MKKMDETLQEHLANNTLTWIKITDKGFPKKNGSYCTIIDDGSFLGVKDPEMSFFFKEGTHLHLFFGEDGCHAESADVYVTRDGFYKLTSDWREKYLKQLPVLYWLEVPALPEEYKMFKMQKTKEQVKKWREGIQIICGSLL